MQAITSQEFLSRSFHNIVFAGGGNRCWWQAGVVEVLSLALGLYASEKFWLKNFHARLPHHLGFRAEYLDLTQSAKLADARTLLMASAAAVPITPIHRVAGHAALDGGFYDSIPLPQDRQGDPETLVLLNRHRADLPQMFTHQQRVYLQPAQKVAAINMDCTSGTNVQLTYTQGRSEALALMG